MFYYPCYITYKVVCGLGGKTNMLKRFAKLWEDVAIEKTEFQRLSSLLKRNSEELRSYATIEGGDEKEQVVLSICLQFREIVVNALWPEPFQPFIQQKAERIWKRSFHTNRRKAMDGKKYLFTVICQYCRRNSNHF